MAGDKEKTEPNGIEMLAKKTWKIAGKAGTKFAQIAGVKRPFAKKTTKITNDKLKEYAAMAKSVQGLAGKMGFSMLKQKSRVFKDYVKASEEAYAKEIAEQEQLEKNDNSKEINPEEKSLVEISPDIINHLNPYLNTVVSCTCYMVNIMRACIGIYREQLDSQDKPDQISGKYKDLFDKIEGLPILRNNS